MEIEFVQISEQLPFPAEFMRYLSASRQQRIHRFRNDNDKKRGLLAELLIQKYASRLYNMGEMSMRYRQRNTGSLIFRNCPSTILAYPILACTPQSVSVRRRLALMWRPSVPLI